MNESQHMLAALDLDRHVQHERYESFDIGVSYGLTLAHSSSVAQKAKDRQTHTRHLAIDLCILAICVVLLVRFHARLTQDAGLYVVLGATAIYLVQRMWKRDVRIF